MVVKISNFEDIENCEDAMAIAYVQITFKETQNLNENAGECAVDLS